MDVSEALKIRQSADFEAPKLRNVRSGQEDGASPPFFQYSDVRVAGVLLHKAAEKERGRQRRRN